MKNIASQTAIFLELCEKNKKIFLRLFDTEALLKIHHMNSNFHQLSQIEASAYKKARQVLSKEIYQIYIHVPKIKALEEIFISSLNTDINFRKNIYESAIADSQNRINHQKIENGEKISRKFELEIKDIISSMQKRYDVTLSREDAIKLLKAKLGEDIKESKPLKKDKFKSKKFVQTAEEMILHMEEKYHVTISRKEALGVLESDFGKLLKVFVKEETKKRFDNNEKHISEKLKSQKDSFYSSKLFTSKKNHKKVGFDFSK